MLNANIDLAISEDTIDIIKRFGSHPITSSIEIDVSKLPHKPKAMSISEFSERYGVTKNNIYVFRCNNADSPLIINGSSGEYFINIGYYNAVRDFEASLKNSAHDIYYLLTTRYSEEEVANFISKRTGKSMEEVLSFMQRHLFVAKEKKALDLSIDKRLVEFVIAGARMVFIVGLEQLLDELSN